jgi:hypothetical protein
MRIDPLYLVAGIICICVFLRVGWLHFHRLGMQRESIEYRYYDSHCDSDMLQGYEDVEERKRLSV